MIRDFMDSFHILFSHYPQKISVLCNITRYIIVMIINIKHKGLRKFYEDADGSRLPAPYLRKVHRILDQLDAVTSEKDILQMGSGIHPLQGDLSGFWAIYITPNFRIIFRFEDGYIYDVDYLDYH